MIGRPDFGEVRLMSRMRLFAALIAALAGTLSLPGGVFASSPSAHAKKKHLRQVQEGQRQEEVH
jgi:hypothetical protein